MRVGVNPEKLSPKKLEHKPHRVIIPVYIPNLSDDYYENQLDVLKLCLDSLLATTDKAATNITVINNNSCSEVTMLLEDYFSKGKIEKLVRLSENRGKVEPVLSEAMASFEEYITISDADVFFRCGWLSETVKLFQVDNKVGVVSPLPVPHLYGYCNDACISDNMCRGRLKWGKVVDTETLKEYEKSVGVNLLHQYYDRQCYFEKNSQKAILGATHMVATYKNFFKQVPFKKVPYVFKNSLEKEFVDSLAQRYGLWRVSTMQAYAYHMGNTFINEEISFLCDEKWILTGMKRPSIQNKAERMVKNICAKIYLKYMRRALKGQ